MRRSRLMVHAKQPTSICHISLAQLRFVLQIIHERQTATPKRSGSDLHAKLRTAVERSFDRSDPTPLIELQPSHV
ncbi:unnamed protein product [Nippostrongylus brasiliensis]|uniref:Transposase n=1 Tax=Nippostrongylus brasiliensis TaxID=27835 RepID=A0A0N4YMR5_NIPBR|nr:unnamed protein product [Nippostrongylus brasiliensis]